jgi:hypothetical protein
MTASRRVARWHPSEVALVALACLALTTTTRAQANATNENLAGDDGDSYLVLLRPRLRRPFVFDTAATSEPFTDDDEGGDEDGKEDLDAIKACLKSLGRGGRPAHQPTVVRLLRRAVRMAVMKLTPLEAATLENAETDSGRKNQINKQCVQAGGAILAVERDAVVTAQGFRVVGTPSAPHDDGGVSAQGGRRATHWGLDRVDQRRLPLDGRSPSVATNQITGAGTMLYVVDSGVMAEHGDFSRVDDSRGGGGDGGGSRVVMRGDFLSAEPQAERVRTRQG